MTIRRVNYRDDPNILQDDPHGGFDVPLDTHLIYTKYSSFENMGSFAALRVKFHLINKRHGSPMLESTVSWPNTF